MAGIARFVFVAVLLASIAAPAFAQPKPAKAAAFDASAIARADLMAQAAPPGELLYTTHCIACHTKQVHWRDRKLAKDWPSLVAEVRRWERAGRLGWSDADVDDVARYLNATIYRFPEAPAKG